MGDTRELDDPLVGSLVAGRYRVSRRLAAGGMGVVYEATQEPLGRRVALKVIRGDAVDDPLARLRFEREAKTASSIQDPHVVVVHDFGLLQNPPGVSGLFLAMEFVEGQTLRAHLQQGRVTWRRSLGVVDHIARALAAAHTKGLVHRDLKPENVMLTTTSGAGDIEYFCKVLDFGLAKGIEQGLFQPTGDQRLTASGGFVGTPGYISPEHLDGAGEDPRQDVYALGIVWWEMLTSRHPFPAETPMKTLLRQMHEEPPLLDEVLRLSDGIPAGGAQLLREMMAKNPRDRPKDGNAVLDRLRSLPAASHVERGVDSDAATLVGGKPSHHVDDIPVLVRHSEVATVDHHPRPVLPANQTLVAPAASPASPEPRRRRPRRRLAPLFAACVVAGTAVGVAVMRVVDAPAQPAKHVASVLVVDAGAPLTEVIIEGVSSFSAMRSLRDGLPPHVLRVYRPGRTELSFDGDVAAQLADRLQGKLVEIGGVFVVFEVKELDQGRVVVGAATWVDAGVVDAGTQADDAGASDIEMPDAGAVPVGPGGLEP